MSKALRVVCVIATALLIGAGAAQGEDNKDIARMNAGAITVITDGNNGQASLYAADLAVLMEAERDLRILPVMGHGPVEALRDLLFLRGIDASIVPSDTVAYMRKQGLIEDIDKKITFIARLGSAQIHVIARKDIASLKDLAGKNINVGAASEPRFVTSSLLFEWLGINFNAIDGVKARPRSCSKAARPMRSCCWRRSPPNRGRSRAHRRLQAVERHRQRRTQSDLCASDAHSENL